MADDDGESCCIISCFVVGVLVFIVGVVLLCVLSTPAHPSIHVTDASLTPPNTTHHHYHLALNITIRNPSVFYKNYNKNIKLVAFCNNNLHKPIGTAEVLPFGQKTHEKDSFTALTFKGEEEEDDFQACGESIDIDGRHYDDIVIKIYISDIYYTAGLSAKDAWQSESEFKFSCYLYITPAHPSIHVTDASLTPPNTTHYRYHLALNITIRNPSFIYETYNKDIKLVAFCNNNLHKPIGTAEVLPFGLFSEQKARFTALTFKGEEEEGEFQACGASKDGLYDDIVIKIYISGIHYWVGPNAAMEGWQSETEFKCNLKVPLITGADAVNGFEDTKCKSSFKLLY
ncbi:hypothetical protein ACLB2K_023531 [Fragaria x ananassa]